MREQCVGDVRRASELSVAYGMQYMHELLRGSLGQHIAPGACCCKFHYGFFRFQHSHHNNSCPRVTRSNGTDEFEHRLQAGIEINEDNFEISERFKVQTNKGLGTEC